MSQQAIKNMELIYKTLIFVLCGMCSYFLYKVDAKVESTYERAIRLEERMKTIESEIKRL